MKISYVSDLHTEFQNYYDFSREEGGDVLLLSGDIVTAYSIYPKRNDPEARSVKRYLSRKIKPLLDKYTHVFYVMGNHDHYRWVFSKTKDTLIESFAALGLDKIRILDKDYVFVGDVLFLGASLWTDFNKGNPLSMQTAYLSMNDYRLILTRGLDDLNYFHKGVEVLTPKDTLDEHLSTIEVFDNVLSNVAHNKCVVMTHMAPSFKSINQFHGGNQLDGAYASDLSSFILTHPTIKYWVHGHTHQNFDYMIGDTRILANQRGYPGETSFKSFSGLSHFEV